jgi:adenine/guanine phosphoribosyltransferase-like PRPP-binding protein
VSRKARSWPVREGLAGYATPVEGETTHTVEETAEILQETPERVREMLATGELGGIPPGATVSREWKVLLLARLEQDRTQHAEERAQEPSEPRSNEPCYGRLFRV